jgi:hypothetical protein
MALTFCVQAAEKVVSVMAGEPQQASSLHQQISQDSVAHCLASSKADRQQSEQLSAAPACSASFVCDVTSAAVHSKDQQPISKKANMKADINVSSKSSMVERHDLKCCTNSKGTTGDVGITSGSNVVGGRSSKVNIARKPVQQLTSESGLVNLSDNDASMKAPGKLEVQRTHRNESMKPETCVSRRGQGKVIGRTSKIAAEPSSVAVQSAPSFPLSGAQQSTGVDKLQSEIQMSKSTKGKGQSKLGGEKPVLFSASSPMDMQTLNHIKQTAANCVTSICQPVSSIQGSNGAACCQSWNLPTSKAGVISRNCVPVTSAQKSAISDVAQAAGTVKPAQTVTASAVDNSRSGQFVLTQKQPAIVKSEPRNGCALGSSTPSGLNQVSPFVDTKNSVGTSNGVASVVSAAAPCSVVENGFKPLIPTSLPVSSVTFSRPGGAVAARVPENFPDLVPSDRKTFGRLDADVSDAGTGKNKKSRRKAKGKDGLTAVGKSAFDFRPTFFFIGDCHFTWHIESYCK